jgi:hypothetical protein
VDSTHNNNNNASKTLCEAVLVIVISRGLGEFNAAILERSSKAFKGYIVVRVKAVYLLAIIEALLDESKDDWLDNIC